MTERLLGNKELRMNVADDESFADIESGKIIHCPFINSTCRISCAACLAEGTQNSNVKKIICMRGGSEKQFQIGLLILKS